MTSKHLLDLYSLDKALRDVEATQVQLAESLKTFRTMAEGYFEKYLPSGIQVPETHEDGDTFVLDMGNYVGAVHIYDHMGVSEIHNLIADAPEHTLFVAHGRIPWLSLGGLYSGRGAYKADGSPLRNLTFTSHGGRSAIENSWSPQLHGNQGGTANITFVDAAICNYSSAHKGALLGHEGYSHGLLTVNHCHFFSPFAGTGAYNDFGYMWGILLYETQYDIVDTTFEPAMEHSVYDHNGAGNRFIRRCRNLTKTYGIDPTLFGLPAGPDIPVELGNGRTFQQCHDRVSEGPASYGDLTVESCTATACGHAGMTAGNPPAGGSAFTVGGNAGLYALKGCQVVEPFGGGVVVWTELQNTDQDPETPNVTVGPTVPSVDRVLLQQVTVEPQQIDTNRKMYILGGCNELTGDRVFKRVGGVKTQLLQTDENIEWDGDVGEGADPPKPAVPPIGTITWL